MQTASLISVIESDETPLTILGTQGVPFSTRYKALSPLLNLDTKSRMRLWNSVGHSLLDRNTCTSPNRTSLAVSSHNVGFGSRILQFANYVVMMGFQDKYRLFFIALRNVMSSNGKYPYNPMQHLMEGVFSYASPQTSCLIFESICKLRKGYCGPGWVEGSKDNRYPLPLKYLDNVKDRTLFLSIKSTVIRELMQLQPASRERLDSLLREGPLKGLEGSSKFQVAMHIRRTDKLWSEAELVHASVFVSILNQVQHAHNKDRPLVLHLLTDDCRVEDEFRAELTKIPSLAANTELRFRCVPTRPDRGHDANLHNFYTLLVDLKLMIDSHAFIGTQSSNMGIITCFYRADHLCFSAEADAPSYVWDSDKSKNS